MIPKGGLNIQSAEIGGRQVFTLVDANGGDLDDGDDVQIKYAEEGSKSSYWYETEDGKVSRIARPADKSGHFKIKKTDGGISLQAASGKFVTATSKTAHLSVTDASEKAVVFEVIENPTVAPAKETPAAGETKE